MPLRRGDAYHCETSTGGRGEGGVPPSACRTPAQPFFSHATRRRDGNGQRTAHRAGGVGCSAMPPTLTAHAALTRPTSPRSLSSVARGERLRPLWLLCNSARLGKPGRAHFFTRTGPRNRSFRDFRKREPTHGAGAQGEKYPWRNQRAQPGAKGVSLRERYPAGGGVAPSRRHRQRVPFLSTQPHSRRNVPRTSNRNRTPANVTADENGPGLGEGKQSAVRGGDRLLIDFAPHKSSSTQKHG